MGENCGAVVRGWERCMTLRLAERHDHLLDDVIRFCDETLAENSVYAVLHRERDRLFPDELFEDLFSDRWHYAAGVGGYGTGGWGRFAHTVLVDMRARLDASNDPQRIFAVTVQAASAAGLVGAKRVLDSTPLYEAVAEAAELVATVVGQDLEETDDGTFASPGGWPRTG